MPYCVLADLERRTSTTDIARLTDDSGGEAANTGTINAAIADADALIDSYLRGRYSLPLSTPYDPILITLSADLAIVNLHQRRFGMTEKVEKRYEQALSQLKDIQSGKCVLKIDDVQEVEEFEETGIRTNCRPRVYTDDLLSRMP